MSKAQLKHSLLSLCHSPQGFQSIPMILQRSESKVAYSWQPVLPAGFGKSPTAPQISMQKASLGGP